MQTQQFSPEQLAAGAAIDRLIRTGAVELFDVEQLPAGRRDRPENWVTVATAVDAGQARDLFRAAADANPFTACIEIYHTGTKEVASINLQPR